MTEQTDAIARAGPSRAPNILVAGSGGAGSNTAHRITGMGLQGVHTLAVNCDRLHLELVDADAKLLVGNDIVHGAGTGGRPDLGQKCMEAAIKEFIRMTSGADVVFIVAGMGGGFGTGAGPVMAKAAKEAGAITVGVAFMPFSAEKGRMETARKGLEELRRSSDAVMVIENDRLLAIAPTLPPEEAFLKLDTMVAENIVSMLETMWLSSEIKEKSAILETMPTEGLAMVMCEDSEGSSVRCEAVDHPLLVPAYASDGSAHIPSRSVAVMLSASDGRKVPGMPTTNVLVGTRSSPGGAGRMLVPLAVGMMSYESPRPELNAPPSLRQADLHTGPWAGDDQ